jgi:16S rRNA (adenine1518-N6/adenine1519-N6)-dimethyltransferase
LDRFQSAAKRSLGQNFLVSEAVSRRIVEAVSPSPGDLVFEIGPGRGALTVPLARSGAEIVAYEIDESLVAVLKEKCRGCENVEVERADIREVDLDAAAQERGKDRYRIVGNIPYHLTSVILLGLPNYRGCERCVLMVQREVGERILSPPGSRSSGILTVFLGSYFDIGRVARVRPGSFRPKPDVESVVLRFTPREREGSPADRDRFLSILKLCFSQRRKKLKSALRRSSSVGDDMEVSRLSGVDVNKRPEELGLDEWYRLFYFFDETEGN